MPKGTLIKAIPIKRQINADTQYDSILLFYRDENGIKRTRFVDRAQVPFYVIKDKNSPEAVTPPMFIERDKVDKVITWSDSLYREIALRTDSMSYYDRINTAGKGAYGNFKNLLKHNYIYDSDMNVVDRYIKQFMEEFEPDINYKLYKTYMDIEVDLMPNGFKDKGYIGFPEEDIAPCPVALITLIDGKELVSYTFVHNNPNNISQQEFKTKYEANPKAVEDEIRNQISERNGLIMNAVNIIFYNSEEETIEAFFNKIHELDPDICTCWNQVFDIKTLINRLTMLYSKKRELKEQGIRGYDQMCSVVSDRKYLMVQSQSGEDIYISPKANYVARKDQSYVDRMDEFNVIDGIFWIDQMLLYANIRKANGQKESYSLDAIASEELGSEKLDYSGYTIKTVVWKNFELFLKYNIFDVVLQKCIEDKNLDFDMLQKLCEVTNTRKYKIFKKTISLKNFVCKFAELQGFIMSNNKNANYGDDGAYFEQQYLNKKQVVESDPAYLDVFSKKENFGAYVGDPNLNDNYGINNINDKPSQFLYANVFDEDFSALYPSIIRALNLDKNTQIGKFFLLDDGLKEKLINNYGYDDLFTVSKNEEATGGDTTSDIGPTLVDSLLSHNWSRIGEKYFDLPTTTDMINELKNKKK